MNKGIFIMNFNFKFFAVIIIFLIISFEITMISRASLYLCLIASIVPWGESKTCFPKERLSSALRPVSSEWPVPSECLCLLIERGLTESAAALFQESFSNAS